MLLFDTPTFELAVSRVLRRRGAHEHEKFSLSQLVRDWHATGLRHTDLNALLQSLIAAHCIRRVATGPAPLYQLTSDGIERLFSPVLPQEEMPTYARDAALLEQVRARPRGYAAHGPLPRRRREDRAGGYGGRQAWA